MGTPSNRGPPQQQNTKSGSGCLRCGVPHDSVKCPYYAYYQGPPCGDCNFLHATEAHKQRSGSGTRSTQQGSSTVHQHQTEIVQTVVPNSNQVNYFEKKKLLVSAKKPNLELQSDNVLIEKKISHFVENQVSRNYDCSSKLFDCSDVTANDCSEVIKQTIPLQISINTINLGQKKGPYDQFKFPRSDPPLTKAGKLEIPKLESLEYLVNLLAGKLQPDLKNIWDQLAGRDVTKNEISKSGMQLTGFDIKNECAKYKKACEKKRYVTSLTNISTLESQIDSQINVINFRRPTEGPLSEILKECGFKQQHFQ